MSQTFRKPQHWSGCAISDVQDRMDHFNNLPDVDRKKLLEGDWTNTLGSDCFDNTSWQRRSD